MPSVVYGLWGGRYLAGYLQPFQVWLHDALRLPAVLRPGPPTPNGRSLFTAGIVLAIMILPIITAISREIFVQTPAPARGGGAGPRCDPLGDDPLAVFPYARSGMVSGVMLGLGRALGETMAVAMVLSTSP